MNALGTKLIELGLKDKPIAIIGENSYQWISVYFGVVNGVGTVVPLDKELSKDEIYNLLKIADCKAIFYTQTYEDYFIDFEIDHKFKIENYFNNNREE